MKNAEKEGRFVARTWTVGMAILLAQSVSLRALADPVPMANFDLSASHPAVAASKSGIVSIGGQLASNGRVSGGTPMTVVSGQMLTPATNAALMQVVSGGSQQLLVNTSGVAVGGAARIDSTFASNLSALSVPAGVTLTAVNFNNASQLNVAGSANILGSLYALQTAPGVTAVLNVANNLNIGSGGVLSGQLPSGAAQLAGLFSSQNMVLNVLGNFSNSGTLSVPGNLNLNVAGGISNTSVSAASPAGISAENINIQSGSGSLVNTGLISAVNALNVSTMSPLTDLSINGTGGVMQDINGSINLRDSLYNGSANINLLGGDYLSPALNINGGYGNVSANVGNVSGQVNSTADNAWFFL